MRWTVLALLAAAALPLAADLLRPDGERCAVDGVQVEPAFRVRIVDDGGTSRSFCGVRCAQHWLARPGTPARSILVTDCASGREIAAGSAAFVRTVAAAGAPDSIRVFASRADAGRFVEAYGGTVLPERPLALAADGGGVHVQARD